jgi:nitrite reductase/ring-hydroxylating ferredoxin subunit
MVVSIRVEKVALPSEGASVRVTAEGRGIALFRVGGVLYALDAKCPHVGGPLDQGSLDGTQVMCPWHGSVFDLHDGKVLRGPATRAVTSYRVRTEGETLVLEHD